MKLIIDISDEMLGAIKDGTWSGSHKLELAIRNGEPYEERSQGEWEKPFEMNGKSYHKCTNCHISSELILINRFCPYCGAKMKGGTEC